MIYRVMNIIVASMIPAGIAKIVKSVPVSVSMSMLKINPIITRPIPPNITPPAISNISSSYPLKCQDNTTIGTNQ